MIAVLKRTLLGAALAFSLLGAGALCSQAAAQSNEDIADSVDTTCPNSKLISGKMLTDICWKCVFPIRISGVNISGSVNADNRPSGASDRKLCICTDGLGVPHPGVVTSFWQPAYVFEFMRTPGCLSSLNGVTLPLNQANRGTTGHDNANGVDGTPGFRHYHMYAFPIMIMLDIFVPKRCNPGGYHDFDLMFLSEVDPTWNHDDLAFFANFENALVASPLAAAACVPDAVAANVGKPISTLWWCAGSWGHLYPLSGHMNGFDGGILQSSRMNARALTVLHRRGILWGTMGDDNLCDSNIATVIPKQQYRFTMFFPKPETQDTHVFGESPLLWGMNRIIPSIGEDQVYIVWRWIDCCNTL